MPVTLGFLSDVGMSELLVIMVVALVIFGGWLPEVARNVGRSVSQFRKGIQDATSEVTKELQLPEESPPASKPIPPAAPANQVAATAGPSAPQPPAPPGPSCAPKPHDVSLN